MTEPLVGVLGGVGPMATAYFLQRVVALTDAQRDQDHVNLIVFNHAAIPDRTAFLLGESGRSPGPVLADDARRITEFGADFLVMPCSTGHAFAAEIQAATHRPFVSMIDLTVADVATRTGDKPVGLLATEGTLANRNYHDAFAKAGVEVITPDTAEQAQVRQIIYSQVKTGRQVDVAALRAVTDSLVRRGAASVILGCTELSVAALDNSLVGQEPFVDAMELLVRATIVRAGRQVRA